jgi:membrane protease YdiL (CAAX protease family)
MNFLSNARLGENSGGKVAKTILFTLLYQIPGGMVMGSIIIINKLRTPEQSAAYFSGAKAGLGALVFFLGFMTALFGLVRQIRKQHKRHWMTLINTASYLDKNKILFGMAIWGVIHLAKIGVYVALNPSAYSFSTNYIGIISFSLALIVLVPLQCAFEEMLFRGYILQQGARVIKQVWALVLGSTILFALMHIFNPEVRQYGFAVVMPFYISLGAICCVITIMDNRNELAIGLHTINNIFALLLLGNDSSAIPPSRILLAHNPSPMSLFDSLYFIFGGAVFVYIMSRKYKWGSWSILWSTLTNDEVYGEVITPLSESTSERQQDDNAELENREPEKPEFGNTETHSDHI